jgi:type I restriction enzyme S subunit
MKKWKEVELQDIALQQKGSIVSGPFGSNIGSRFFVEEGIPVIRGNNLSLGKEKFKDDGFVYLTEEKAFRNCEAIKDDIIFTCWDNRASWYYPSKYKISKIHNFQ